MEHFSRLPLIDISCYQWVCSKKDTNLWQRQALAGENTWVLKPKERREMFLGGHISLPVPTTLDDIRRAAEEVWRRLRFEHPEISLASSCDDGGKCLIEHRTPRDDDEVRAWAKRTVIVKASLQRFSFSDARSAISQRKPGKSDPAFVHLCVQACTMNPRTTSIGFMFHVDHLCADGIGIRILAHCFFRLLAAELSAVRDQVGKEIHWQRIAENLPPPWTSLMNDNQRTNGAAFDDAVRCQCALILSASVCVVLSTFRFSTFI